MYRYRVEVYGSPEKALKNLYKGLKKKGDRVKMNGGVVNGYVGKTFSFEAYVARGGRSVCLDIKSLDKRIPATRDLVKELFVKELDGSEW